MSRGRVLIVRRSNNHPARFNLSTIDKLPRARSCRATGFNLSTIDKLPGADRPRGYPGLRLVRHVRAAARALLTGCGRLAERPARIGRPRLIYRRSINCPARIVRVPAVIRSRPRPVRLSPPLTSPRTRSKTGDLGNTCSPLPRPHKWETRRRAASTRFLALFVTGKTFSLFFFALAPIGEPKYERTDQHQRDTGHHAPT